MPMRTDIRTIAASVMPPAHRPQPDRWRGAGVEPALADLMNDPLTALVMRRDGIDRHDVMATVAAARWRLSRTHRQGAAQDAQAAGALVMVAATSEAQQRRTAC